MKDKKQVIVLVALVLAIVCVGAFQFVASGAKSEPVATTKKESKAAEAAPKDTVKNPLFAQNLPARDPFQPAALPTKPDPIPTPTTPTPMPKAPPLPDVGIDKTGGFGGGNSPVLVQNVPNAGFSYTLSGVMLGAKRMAVFTDSQGNQRLILLGGSIDPDSKVISIDKDVVTVSFHGKTIRMTVEGNSNAK